MDWKLILGIVAALLTVCPGLVSAAGGENSSEHLNFPPPIDPNNDSFLSASTSKPNIIHPFKRNARIIDTKVECEDDHMTVMVIFDQEFNGVVYSKGHYRKADCVWIPADGRETHYKFDIPFDGCGTVGQTSGNGTKMYHENVVKYFENVLVVQNDPSFQEASDGLRRIRCDWKKRFDKNLIFQPFSVNDADAVNLEFSGEKIETRMEIVSGNNPLGKMSAQTPVRIGDDLTLSVKIFSKQPAESFDVVVRNCFSHDGDQNNAVQLTDTTGCAVRPEVFGIWQTTKDTRESGAIIISYVPFKAFKFPDSGQVVFQCDLSICRESCNIECKSLKADNRIRLKRTTSDHLGSTDVNLRSMIKVLGPNWDDHVSGSTFTPRNSMVPEGDYLCVAVTNFAVGFSLFLVVLIIVIVLLILKICRLRKRLQKIPVIHTPQVFHLKGMRIYS